MALKFNPVTGLLDYFEPETKLQPDDGTQRPTAKEDGYVSVVKVGSDGRLYFFVEGNRYYVTGTESNPEINIQRGQPIGLMGVTYAEDVT